MNDRLHWDKKFAARPNEPGNPESFLIKHRNRLNKGSVLDLASGDGRHSLFLAAKGFAVTAVDISSVALSRLDQFASRQELQIKTVQMDFDEMQSRIRSGAFDCLFDNLIIFFFKPRNLTWQLLPDLLKPGGKIILCTFNLQQHHSTGFSRRFCLTPDELTRIHPQLDIELHHSLEDEGRFLDGYIFKKIDPKEF